MPSHVPAELKLDEPVYEEDICDLSPYSLLPSSTTSTTINSSLGSYSPRSILLEDDIPMSGNDMYHMLLKTPKRSLFNSLPTQSSSLHAHDKQPRKLQMELDSLGVDPVVIAKLQRWVLGIAVGVLAVHFPFTSLIALLSVEFDIDTGPTMDGLYPPLTLLPAESETLYVSAMNISAVFITRSLTGLFVHSQIQYNLTRDLSHTPFAFACNHYPIVMTDRSPRMALSMAFHISYREEMLHRSGDTNRYFLLISHVFLCLTFPALPCPVDPTSIPCPVLPCHKPLWPSI